MSHQFNKNNVVEVIKSLFSFKGKMNRKKFFFVFLIIIIAAFIVAVIYETSPLEELERLILKGLSSGLFITYLYDNDGYFIDLPTFMDIEKNKDKYPQCYFPQPYIEKETMEGGYRYLDNASDKEYKTCLRKHGLGN